MKQTGKIILTFLLVPGLAFAFNANAATTNNTAALIAQLQQEIENLVKQIIALIQASIQKQTVASINTNTGTTTQVQSNSQVNIQGQTQNSSGAATLTINVSGATAYVSINNGAQFAYTSPITLNNGDTYSVKVSVPSTTGIGSSNSTCSGTVSAGGSYICNMQIVSH